MKKRILSLVLALLLIVPLFPIKADAAGSNNMAQNLLDLAASQIGYREGKTNITKYGAWYPSGGASYNGYAWCAMFISWCARHSGVPDTVIPNFASCSLGINWFKERGLWHEDDGNYNPRPGDLLFLDTYDPTTYRQDGAPDHVAIVESVSNTTIYTVEGNTINNMVERRERPRNETILGFASPEYSKVSYPKHDVSVYNVKAPEYLKAGSSFYVEGEVYSKSSIIWLYIDVRDNDGHFYSYNYSNPGTQLVNISSIDTLRFSNLKSGNYKLYVEAIDSDYNYAIREYPFVVSSGTTYTVSYNANGGEGAPNQQLKGKDIEINLSDITPTRDEYLFQGWSTDPNASVPQYTPGQAYNVNGNTTLYAVWKPCTHEYSVKLVFKSCTEPGGFLYTCKYCGHRYMKNESPAAGHTYIGNLCIKCGYVLNFSDVSGSPFENDIYWAAKKNIVSGYSDGTFHPNDPCTRAQVVAFLWRAAGRPVPKTTASFTDMVSSSSPYYEAICWATEKGIVAGFDDGSFRPGDTCTRAQFVTFLWRYNGRPSVNISNPFTDVEQNSYYNAIMWAYKTKVTQGYDDGRFDPNGLCTRGHVVAFIHRDLT